MTRNGSTSRDRKVRAGARQRDRSNQAPCWICGQPIDYTLTEGRDCWEPDHFYPVVTHPHLRYDPGNTRPSHQRCNRSRGQTQPDVIMERAIGMQSRKW